MQITPCPIETPRLLVRSWELEDAERLKEAIDTSLDHLRAWMPWAHREPENLEEKRARIARLQTAFSAERKLHLGVCKRDGSRVLGSASIAWHGGPEKANIGYWLRADEVGQGYATESVLGCMFAAFRRFGALTVEIYCDPANHRSAAIPARLDFLTLEPAVRKTADDRDRLSLIWQMERARFEEIHGATQGFSLRDKHRTDIPKF